MGANVDWRLSKGVTRMVLVRHGQPAAKAAGQVASPAKPAEPKQQETPKA